MTAVVPYSAKLREAVDALLPAGVVRCRRHPSAPAHVAILQAVGWQGNEIVRDLVEQFGECWWDRGRWHTRRPQLSFRGMA